MKKLLWCCVLLMSMLLHASVAFAQSDNSAGEVLIVTAYTYEGRYEYRYISSLVQAYQERGGQCKLVVEVLGCQSLDGHEQWFNRFKSLIAKHPNPHFVVLVGAEAISCYLSLSDPKYKKIPVACVMSQRYAPALRDYSIPALQTDSLNSKLTVDFQEIMKPFNVRFFHYYDYDVESGYRLIQHLYPGTTDLALISDNTFVGLGEMRVVEEAIRERYPHINLHFIDGRYLDVDEAVKRVSELPKKAVALLCIWRYDRKNVIYLNNADYLFKEANPKLPVFSLTSTGMGYWCIGGASPVYDDKVGEKVAQYIYNYVDLRRVDMPVDYYCYPNEYVIDIKSLKDHGFSRKMIPSRSRLVNDDNGWDEFFEDNKWYLLLLIVVFTLLTIGFILSTRYSFRIRSLMKRLEEEKQSLLRSEAELRVAKEKAENSNRLKTAFINSMSHEIRTPLNSIVGFSTILEDATKGNNDVKEYIKIISHNSDLLLKLINDVLEVSLLDSDMQEFVFVKQDLTELCVNTVALQRASANPFVELRFIHSTPSIIAETDSARLEQILVNLVSNAVKFTQVGFVELKVEPNDAMGEWVFSVTDTGCGIPEEKREKVFERFIKLDEYTQGTGLGLSICKLTTQKLGGRIWIDPNYKEGTRFMFTIPYEHKPASDEVTCD